MRGGAGRVRLIDRADVDGNTRERVRGSDRRGGTSPGRRAPPPLRGSREQKAPSPAGAVDRARSSRLDGERVRVHGTGALTSPLGISRPKNWGIVAASDALSAVVVAKDDRRRVDGEQKTKLKKNLLKKRILTWNKARSPDRVSNSPAPQPRRTVSRPVRHHGSDVGAHERPRPHRASLAPQVRVHRPRDREDHQFQKPHRATKIAPGVRHRHPTRPSQPGHVGRLERPRQARHVRGCGHARRRHPLTYRPEQPVGLVERCNRLPDLSRQVRPRPRRSPARRLLG